MSGLTISVEGKTGRRITKPKRTTPKRTLCDPKIAELRATLTPSLRLDHKISCWYGYAPFQSVRNKFKSDLRI